MAVATEYYGSLHLVLLTIKHYPIMSSVFAQCILKFITRTELSRWNLLAYLIADNRIFKACRCGEYLVKLINVINGLLDDASGLRANSVARYRAMDTWRFCSMH